MARIPEEEIERIKRTVDLAALVRRDGVKLERHGKDLIGLCPMHADRSPSLVITPEKNLWHCLGACQTGGSVIDWVMKTRGVSFRHAIEMLRDEAALPPLEGEVVKISTVRTLTMPFSADASDAELLADVARFYHGEVEAAREYLRKRGIENEETIERFQLGFAGRALGLHLPQKNRKLGGELRERLQTLGIMRESGHEHFCGCLTIPVFDHEGNVVSMYGRKIADAGKLRAGTPVHMYLAGPHRGVWNLGVFAESKEIILCEALIDALTFWCAGFRNVTSAYGINGFTEEIFEALRAYGIERVLIAYDRDEAGDTAAAALATRLGVAGVGAFRIAFPRGMDANEYALKVTPAEKSLGLLVRTAEWMRGPTRVSVLAHASSLAAEEPLGEKAPDSTPHPPPSESPTLGLDSIDPLDVAFGDRHYRVRGIEKCLSYEQMKVQIRVSRDAQFFIDTLDLVNARQKAQLIKSAAVELGVKEEIIKADVSRLHGRLEGVQDALIKKTLAPKETAGVVLSADDETEALGLLRDPNLIRRIIDDYERCGFTGERTNKLVAHLAAVSRKLDQPLAIIVQSSSAAGKSALMEAVLAFVPDEERVQYSAMTGQSLFYMGETNLKHKILAISEEEGAERAAYALKLLQSEGRLTIASTGKDPHTGMLVTHEYRVEGPVMIFVTTTAIEIDEELRNRCIVLTVDENREQTRAIHRLQREAQTIEGLLAENDRDATLRRQRNAQRLIRPLLVVNPYARQLTFLDVSTRTRRDHVKYLTLIRTIALLHQHQREIKTLEHRGKTIEYIEVTLGDIALANELAHEVLGRSLDELAPQTRRSLQLIDEMVTAECQRLAMHRCDYRFSQRQVRESTGWPDYQVRIHMRKLTELEYLLIHRGGRGQSFVYELLYHGEGKSGRPFLMGLLDVEQLGATQQYDGNRDSLAANRDSEKPDRDSPETVQRQPRNSGGTTPETTLNTNNDGGLLIPNQKRQEKAHKGLMRKTPIVRAARRRNGNGRAEP